MSQAPARASLAPVVTMLLPAERSRVDAAGEGLYRTLHRDSLDDVSRDLHEHRVHAIILSVARCAAVDTGRVARLIREFPRVPAVALLSQLDAATPRAVLTLGHTGIRSLVDVRTPGGWHELREVLTAERAGHIDRLAL